MENNNLIVGFVLVVAIVGLFVMIGGFSSNDITGQALARITDTCTETDGGDDKYVFGVSTGTYPWGGVANQIPDRCRLMNNQVVSSCTNCKLMEYYCRADGYLFWNFYTGVDCDEGALVSSISVPECVSDADCASDEVCNAVNVCEEEINELVSHLEANTNLIIPSSAVPVIGDTNDYLKYGLVARDDITNVELVFPDGERYTFYDDGLHNDNLPNDNYFVAWAGPFSEGVHAPIEVNYDSSTERVIQPVTIGGNYVIPPLNLPCETLVENNGAINIVVATVGYSTPQEAATAAAASIDYDGVNNGIFSYEPFASNKQLFNVRHVDGSSISPTTDLISAGFPEVTIQGYSALTACEFQNQFNVIIFNQEYQPSIAHGRWGYQLSGASAHTNAHEFGHSFGDLMDEVSGSSVLYGFDEEQCFFSPEVDCTNTEEDGWTCSETENSQEDCLQNAQWTNQIGDGCGAPGVIDCTPADVDYELEVGCFLGCLRTQNLYRSTRSDIMGSGSDAQAERAEETGLQVGFSLVNQQTLCQRIEQVAGTVDGIC